jgi:hypothetical protein
MQDKDQQLLWEAYVNEGEPNFPNFREAYITELAPTASPQPTGWQRAGRALKAGAEGVANVVTAGGYDAVKNTAAVAQGTDPASQMQALQQKDQGHDQMDQQNTQTDQSQEQRLAALEQKFAELEQLITRQQPTPTPAAAPPAAAPPAAAPPAAAPAV